MRESFSRFARPTRFFLRFRPANQPWIDLPRGRPSNQLESIRASISLIEGRLDFRHRRERAALYKLRAPAARARLLCVSFDRTLRNGRLRSRSINIENLHKIITLLTLLYKCLRRLGKTSGACNLFPVEEIRSEFLGMLYKAGPAESPRALMTNFLNMNTGS